MGNLCSDTPVSQEDSSQLPPAHKIESADLVKLKLKQVRDRINVFLSRKQVDMVQIDQQI